jgi:hypothetical protein
MTALDRIIEKEDFASIIKALTPTQLAYARLRLVGLTDGEIARLYGRTAPSAVSMTLARAKRSIARLHPDLAHHMTGRKKNCRARGLHTRTLDWDWLLESHDREGKRTGEELSEPGRKVRRRTTP